MSDDSPIEFPCDIPIKAFGPNADSFKQTVVDIVGRHFPEQQPLDVAERLSRADKYLSLTLTVTAGSRQQIDDCYRELSSSDEVLMVL